MSSQDVGPPRPAYPIESVDNALKLLKMFGEGGAVRVAQASEHIGVARSTAHRLLAMLQYHGYVHQDPASRAYVAGPALLMTGLSAVRKLDVRNQARPYLQRLSAATNETVHLALLQGATVLFLDAVEGDQPVRVASRVGEAMPAHCTSVGKALLARLDEEDLLARYPNEHLAGLTEASVIHRSDLFRMLDVIRARGFAESHEEAEAGIGSVGVAIPHPFGVSDAAISVSAPLDRLSDVVFKKLASDALDAAEQIADAVEEVQN